MNILVTGGAGYKGVMLTNELLKKGHKVTVLDNFMYGFDSILHLAANKNLSIIKRDIRNDLKHYVKDKDVIIHLAAVSGYPACEANPHSAHDINISATERLVKLLSKDQRLIYASTTSFYGNSGVESDEGSEITPTTVYSATKYAAEKIVMQKANAISLRFATIFGISPKMRVDLLVNDFTYHAVNDRCVVLYKANSKRTFLHIKDAIAGYLFALENFDSMKNNIYNLGDEKLNFSKAPLPPAVAFQVL